MIDLEDKTGRLHSVSTQQAMKLICDIYGDEYQVMCYTFMIKYGRSL
jgi:hypothetical protein